MTSDGLNNWAFNESDRRPASFEYGGKIIRVATVDGVSKFSLREIAREFCDGNNVCMETTILKAKDILTREELYRHAYWKVGLSENVSYSVLEITRQGIEKLARELGVLEDKQGFLDWMDTRVLKG